MATNLWEFLGIGISLDYIKLNTQLQSDQPITEFKLNPVPIQQMVLRDKRVYINNILIGPYQKVKGN